MSRFVWCLGVLALLCPAERSAAGDLCPGSLGRELECTRCAAVACRCPDNYCPKPCPCIPCPALPASPDCYCPKPPPCPPCLCLSWCPDNYCPKPCPQFCWPVNRQFYRCGPDDCEAAPTCAATAKAPLRPAGPSRQAYRDVTSGREASR